MNGAPPTERSRTRAQDRLLPWRDVRALTGISRTTAWRLQNCGRFPLPVVISPGRVGWRESDLNAWKAGLAVRGATPPDRPRPGRPRRAPELAPLAADLAPAAAAPQPSLVRPRRRARPPAADQMAFDF